MSDIPSRLPPELIDYIVLDVLDGGASFVRGRALSRADKRALSPCILTCKHWAALLRPALFRHITLRSPEDIDTLIAVAKLHLPGARLMTDTVRSLTIAVNLASAAGASWLRHTYKLECFMRHAALRMVCLSNATRQPSSNTACLSHTLFSRLPTSLPRICFRYTTLSINGLVVTSAAEISRVLERLALVQFCAIQNVLCLVVPLEARLRRQCAAKQPLGVVYAPREFARDSAEDAGASSFLGIPASLVLAARCPQQDKGVWVTTISLLPHLFSQYDFKFRTALYTPGGDHYQAPDVEQEIQVLSDVVASLEATLTPFSEERSTYVESLLLSLPPEAADEELDWAAWEACLLKFDPAFMPKITIETRSSAPFVLTTPEAGEAIASRRLLVQLGGPRRKGPERRERSITPAEAEEPGLNIFTPMHDFPGKQIREPGGWGVDWGNVPGVHHSPALCDLSETPSDVTLVPQLVYSPWRDLTEQFEPLPTIHFNQIGGKTFGLWVSQVLTCNLDCDFINGDERLPLSKKRQTILIRINWPGYLPWEIITQGFAHQSSIPITRGKLTRTIAQAIQSMIMNESSGRSPEFAEAWSLERMSTRDILLTELHQVSEDSWQPVLCCRTSCVRPSGPDML
ncbi:hypothetical protein PsYK624_146630 [Phanerochaete sordida]|uniref:Uncharacterized protein n=1 Tax=Phanerochaete sordida TaxID=48140 RepID=A0A9P3GMB6_9APHY|nr:hypothetical protein PsYK624_146630 [Phanerochaete sordida]